MEDSKLIFNCPECAIRLSLEPHFAGVVGPCPNCNQSIQAPALEEFATSLPTMPPAADVDYPKWIDPPETLSPDDPDQAPSPPGEVEGLTTHGHWWWLASAAVIALVGFIAWDIHQSPRRSQPVLQPPMESTFKQASPGKPPARAMEPTVPESPEALPVEPPRVVMVRSLPRSRVMDPMPPLPEPSGPSEPETAIAQPPMGGVLLPNRPLDLPKLAARIPPLVIASGPSIPESPAIPELDPVESIREKYAALDDQPYLGHSPERLLKEFLAAESLMERWPMMVTESAAAELLGSMLDRELPPLVGTEREYQDARPDLGHTDHVFRVTVRTGKGATSTHRVVVRQWLQERAPKVLADPLMDLLGGRLESFASQPQEGEGEFDVVVSVMARCSDPDLPDPGGKFTLKLMGMDHGGEIARAHALCGGPISQLLADGSFRLSYGNPTACRVQLRWNQEDSAAEPWLEALGITRFGWGEVPEDAP